MNREGVACYWCLSRGFESVSSCLLKPRENPVPIGKSRWIVQLIFDSEARLSVDHFANLASYSTVQWCKTMGKTMTGAKSFTSAVLPCSERFRLRSAPPRCYFFISDPMDDGSLLHIAPIVPSFHSNFRLFALIILLFVPRIQRERREGRKESVVFSNTNFPILSFTWILFKMEKRIARTFGETNWKRPCEINQRNSSRFSGEMFLSCSWTNSLVATWMETIRSDSSSAFSSRSDVHLHVEVGVDLLMAARSRWF